jgi:hypothetical protein
MVFKNRSYLKTPRHVEGGLLRQYSLFFAFARHVELFVPKVRKNPKFFFWLVDIAQSIAKYKDFLVSEKHMKNQVIFKIHKK